MKKIIILFPLFLMTNGCANNYNTNKDIMEYQNTFITSYFDGYLKTLPKVVIVR